MWGWGILASFLVHAVVALIILIGIPFDLPKPEAEETVSVEIVPPPEEAMQAEPAKPAETQPEAPQPTPEKPKEIPAKETAEKTAEQEGQPPPPPPPPPQSEEPQQQPEQQAEPPAEAPDAPQEPEASRPLDNFRPVFQFGETDQGPEQSLQGSATEEESATEEDTPEETHGDNGAAVQQQADGGGASAGAGQAAEETPLPSDQQQDAATADKPADSALPDEIALPDAGLPPAASQADGAPKSGDVGEAAGVDIVATKPDQDKKTDAASRNPATRGGGARPALKKAKKLFSTSATDNPMAMIAMGTMSRGERAAELCNSELGAQLANGTPRYAASRLPKPRLGSGNVIDVETAFSTRSQWYNVSFRCEVDKDAMKVVSFAHDVGAVIPRTEWKNRRLPSPN